MPGHRRAVLGAGLAVLLAGAAARGEDVAVATMRAVVVVDGQPVVRELPRPHPAAGQVLVRVHAAGVNPVDWKIATGRAGAQPMGRGAPPPPPDGGASRPAGSPSTASPPPGPEDGTPAIPGFDASGVVEAIGAGVSRYKAGDAVIVWSKNRGTYAEHVAVDVDTVAAKPAGMSFAQAAAIGHASITAWNMLVDVAQLKAGQRVLILGAAGGVGSTAIQVAHNLGAHVIATASGSHLDYLRSLGADEVIDYTREAFEQRVHEIDVVINTVDADNARRAVSVIRRGGWLVSLVGLPTEQCAAAGVQCSSRTMDGTPYGEVLERLAQWARQGRFSVHVDRAFGLEQVGEAWAYSRAGHTTGKIVIRLLP